MKRIGYTLRWLWCALGLRHDVDYYGFACRTCGWQYAAGKLPREDGSQS